MSKLIYCTREIPAVGIDLLKNKGYTVDIGDFKIPPTKKDLIKALERKNYDAVISFLTDSIDEDIFNACPTVKIFANYANGYNNIDVSEAKKRNIIITNTAGTSSLAVAEHTISLMFALSTRVVEGDRFIREGKFKGWDPNLFMGTDIFGEIIGIIGSGGIGSRVAHILKKGFNCHIVYHDVKRNEQLEKDCGAEYMSIDDVLKNADIVSLHVPLLPSTHHLINTEKLSLMKKTSLLINTSRGAVIDEEALVYALKNKIISGAGIDVFEFEPELTKGLDKLDNIIMTPHIASSKDSARSEMAILVAKNIISVFETGKGVTEVDSAESHVATVR